MKNNIEQITKVAPTRGCINAIKAAYYNGTHLTVTDLEVTLKLPFVQADSQLGLYEVKPLTGGLMIKTKDADVDEFPHIEDKESQGLIELDFAELKNGLKFLQRCISKEETRYYICSVFFNTTTGEMVATDGHRLGKHPLEGLEKLGNLPAEFGQSHGFIIPEKAINILVNLETNSNNINLSLVGKEIQFSCNDFILHSKVIDGNYPEYERVIPVLKDDAETIKINKKIFLADYKKAKLCTFDRNENIIISNGGFSRDNQGDFVIESKAMHRASNKADNLGRIYGFNAKLIFDALSVINNDLLLKSNDMQSPAIHSCANGAIYVIMPMRVTN
jgi:DNA polymerase III subunit beta